MPGRNHFLEEFKFLEVRIGRKDLYRLDQS